MKNLNKFILFTIVISLALSAFSQTGEMQPPVAASFEAEFNIDQSQILKSGGYLIELTIADALQAGGDRLVALQNNDGGWDWPLDDGDPNSTSPVNTIGPIGMGLAQAYLSSLDPDHLDALDNAGDLLLTKTNNFSPSDGYLADILDQVFGVTTYTDHVTLYFYSPLAAGTYDRNGAGTLYSTATYVDLIRTARASQGIANLAAWDIGMGLVGAESAGAGTTAWIAGVKAEIDELDGNEYYDVIGLAGAVYGLAFVGEDFDPSSGEHAAASNIGDLADILISYQIDNGGFAWNSNYVIPNDGNETTQETSAAIFALNEVDRDGYLMNISGAANYLRDIQLTSGGWENYTASGENNEITGEAMWAIKYAGTTGYYNSTTGHYYATLQDAIDAADDYDVIEIAVGLPVFTSTININKPITLKGAPTDALTLIQTSGSATLFNVTGANVTIQDLEIEKTDKDNQTIIYVGGNDFELHTCEIHGQFVMGDGQVERGMVVVGGLTGYYIHDNSIYGLRQPAYINNGVTGNIDNNYTAITKGWVVVTDNIISFSGNTWGSGSDVNYYDIALINQSGSVNNYPDIVTMSNNNNDAIIENQHTSYSLAILSIVHVDGSVATTGNGSILDPYKTIAEALPRAAVGGRINVAEGTYPETGQIVINKDVNIIGDNSAKGVTTITPTANTGSSGDARGWFLVNDGIEFNMSNVTLDGLTFLVYQGVRHKGFGTFDNVTFYNIKYNESGPTYGGVALAVFGLTELNVHVTNSHFSEIGRVGVLYFGSQITGSNFTGNTYIGKGADDWLDYALDISAGAVVAVDNCNISNCLGVASSDGSTSGAIMVTTYFGPGTNALITNCTLTGNSTGIMVGYDEFDGSTVEAHYNDISGNTSYGVSNSGSMIVDATSNYWGDPTGPYHPTLNVGGLGNEVGDNVLFDPWFVSPDFGEQVDIAIHEIGCAGFEVVLRPNFDPGNITITNVQFTVKYPESVDLTDLFSAYGLIVGYSPPAPAGYKYITYVGVDLPNIDWVSGEEYVVLTFNHDQTGIDPDVFGDFVIVPDSEANTYTEYYTEWLGSDVTGYIFANAEDVLLTGCPVWNETQDLWYYEIQPAIDEANIPGPDVIRAYNVIPNNGEFVEDLVVDRAITLLGPNVGISPNTGIRVDEVVIYPATSSPFGEIIKVNASNVTVDGFTVDGDNPALTSGYLGTNGADLDAAEAFTVYVDNVNNMNVKNNIIKNFTFFGITIYGASFSAPSTSGHLVHDNLIQDMGTYDPASGIDRWGGGVLIYNDQYARITDNVMTNVRTGIQTGNFHDPNPGDPMYQLIDNNTMQVRRRGIFYNLHTGNPVPLTLSNNTITALANTNETVWGGILMSSLSDESGIATNNFINGSGLTVPSEGYEIWNVKSDAPALIAGGVVENVDIGVFANNYEGYNSNGGNGAHAIITGMTILPNATGIGIYGLDSPDYSGTVAANVDIQVFNNVIDGGVDGIKLAENNFPGSVSALINDNSITGNSGYGINSTISTQVSATCNWWGSADMNIVASEVFDDNVVYIPYLTDNTENSPSAYPDGFDPAGPCEAPLDLKVFLQGPYIVGSEAMTTSINLELPAGQPFNVAPWNYTGTETLLSPLPAEIVDWVLVELRSDENTLYDRVAGLLYEDGSITASFAGIDQLNPYYFVVYHRNHMPVMSANAIYLDDYTFPYDFTVETNLYGPNLPTPVQAAIELETDIWGLIAGDVTANGILKYSGPGNDRGPIIARIVAETGSNNINGSTTGYWYEDVNLNSIVLYIGTANDRAIILTNLNTLTGTLYLNNTYSSVVPGAISGAKDAGSNDGPFDILISESDSEINIELETSQFIDNGMVDNIQFALAWNAGDTEIENMLSSFTSEFMLTAQGEVIELDGIMYQVYASVTPVYLPQSFNESERVTVMAIENAFGLSVAERLWIADDAFTAENNAVYYVSVWGSDQTGIIHTASLGIDNISNSGTISIYPNPVSNDVLFMQMNTLTSEMLDIKIFDAQGKLVKILEHQTDEVISNTLSIDVSNFTSGIYLINVIGETVLYKDRFIVN